MAEEDESFLEEEASDKEESFEEDMDNDEITPGEEGFMQGYDKSAEEEEKPKQPVEEEKE